METIQQIIERHETFLAASPRKRTIMVQNMRGDKAALFYSDSPDLPGVALQFVDDGLCYVFNNEPRWVELGVYEDQDKFFLEQFIFQRKRSLENA
jgi:hypothetical protein